MSAKEGGTSSGSTSRTGSSSSSGNVSRAGITHWFTSEIQQMMHGFGDCRKPLNDTALLVEEIVHQQVSALLYQACDVATLRSARFIGMEDLLFLLRKDKVKLARLLRYLDLKDMKATVLKGSNMEEDDGTESGEKVIQPMKKRRKICHDFLSSIDQSGELVALFDDDKIDDVKHDRLVRAELQSRGMDQKHYLEFCEARQINFSRKYKSQRFKDWLMAGVNIDIKPNLPALEILSYFSYETVAQVVDLALLVKQDMRSGLSDPLAKNTPSVCINYHDHSPSSTGSVLGRPGHHPGITSPTTSPPSTPSTPGSTSGVLGSSSSSGLGSSGSGLAHKSKSKKRRKSGHGQSLEVSSAQAILPSDVQEAMRRFGHCIGPFASSTKVNNLVSPKMRLLCC